MLWPHSSSQTRLCLLQTWAVDEKLYRLGEDGSPCRVDVPVGYRCESDSLDMDDLACIPQYAPGPSCRVW